MGRTTVACSRLEVIEYFKLAKLSYEDQREIGEGGV